MTHLPDVEEVLDRISRWSINLDLVRTAQLMRDALQTITHLSQALEDAQRQRAHEEVGIALAGASELVEQFKEVVAERNALREQLREANILLREGEALLCDEQAGETADHVSKLMRAYFARYFTPTPGER